MKAGELSIALLSTALLWLGCTSTTAQVRVTGETTTRVEPHEAIAVIFSREFELSESEIAGCLSDAVLKARPTLQVISPEEFRSAAFPDLAPEAAPTSLESLAILINHPGFRNRIAPLGIRYLISVHGKTRQLQQQSGGCEEFGGPGGGGIFCATLVSWDRKSELVATVIDLKQGFVAGKMEASASGQPWFFYFGYLLPLPLGVPLGMPAFTETRACQDLGGAVAKFLAGEKLPNPEEKQEWTLEQKR